MHDEAEDEARRPTAKMPVRAVARRHRPVRTPPPKSNAAEDTDAAIARIHAAKDTLRGRGKPFAMGDETAPLVRDAARTAKAEVEPDIVCWRFGRREMTEPHNAEQDARVIVIRNGRGARVGADRFSAKLREAAEA